MHETTKSILKITGRGVAALSLLGLLSGCMVSQQRLSNPEHYQNSQKDLQKLLNRQEKVQKPITLSEAIARTLKYNLDYRVKLVQLALANGELTMAQLALLPEITGEMGYAYRSNYQSSYVINDDGTLSTSTSSRTPRHERTGSIGTSWNILDWGVSYVRAQQQANRVLIAEEQRRKEKQKIVQQVILAYWQAYNAQQMFADVEGFRRKVEAALIRANRVQKSRAASGTAQLEYQGMLVDSLRRANSMRLQMIKAKQELARLMSLSPGDRFKLSPPGQELSTLPALHVKLPQLDVIALTYRPELREYDYKQQIADKGTLLAILDALPGITFDLGYNYTNNRYTVNNEWMDMNINASYNIMKLATLPFAYDQAKKEQMLNKLQRMSMTMSILTQVRLAYIQYLQARTEFRLSYRKNQISQKLYQHTLRRKQASAGNEQQVISKALSALNARMDQSLMYANAQDALSNLYTSVGIDYIPVHKVETVPLKSLQRLVRRQLIGFNTLGFNEQILNHYKQIHREMERLKKDPFACQLVGGKEWKCSLNGKKGSAVVGGKKVVKAKSKKTAVVAKKTVVKAVPKAKVVAKPAVKKVAVQKGPDPFDCKQIAGKWKCEVKAQYKAKKAVPAKTAKVKAKVVKPAVVKPKAVTKPALVARSTATVSRLKGDGKPDPFICHSVAGKWKCVLKK